MNQHHRMGAKAVGLCLTLSVAIVACGDDDTVDPTTTSSSSSSAGGASSSSSSAGGMGGAGGSVSSCLPATEHAGVFDITDPTLCVVAKYTTAEQALDLTWGRHGGPMLVRTVPDAGGTLSDAEVVRLSPPAGATGALTSAAETYDLDIDTTMQFLGAQALDVPGTNGTLLSYTGFDTTGEVRVFDGTTPVTGIPMVGFFIGATLSTSEGTRLLHTGSTVLGDGVAANGDSGLYQAEFCTGLTLCATPAPSLVEAWAEFNGTVGFDGDGNAFASQFDATAGTTELRGFDAASIAPGAATPASGVTLATFTGSGTNIAALRPTSDDGGWVFLQPATLDAMFNPIPQDVEAHRFTDSGGVIAPDGGAAILTLSADPKPQVNLLADDQDRVWVGVPGTGETTFYVLARAD